jgi:hypothetical protein
MVGAGWLLEDEGYLSDLLLQLGSTALLVAPVVYVERLLSRQIGEVRDELEDLRRRVQRYASTYERIRETQQSGPSRTSHFERIIQEARDEGRDGSHSAEEVANLFKTGSDGERITALGMMQGNRALVDADAIVVGISDSRSAFEQAHALVLAREVWDLLPEDARDRIAAAIEVQMRPDGYIRRSTTRHAIARDLQDLARSRGGRNTP